MRRTTLARYAAFAATITVAAACDQTTPTAPLSGPGPVAAGLLPVGSIFSGPATAVTGQVVVCKTIQSHDTYNVPTNAVFTYDIAYDYMGQTQPQDQLLHTVSLSPGQCVTVFNRPTPSSPDGGTEYQALIAVSERSQSGYSINNISISQTEPNSSSAVSHDTAYVVGNYFHGYVINFTNQTSGLSGAGDPDPNPDACVRSQGYFKTHQSAVADILASPFNTTTTFLSGGMLTIGGEPNLSAAHVVAYLSRPTRGNVRISVERQLIAAELNVLAGASASSAILSEIAEANGILANSSHTSAQVNRLHQIESDLDEFNNGATGDPANSAHCG